MTLDEVKHHLRVDYDEDDVLDYCILKENVEK